MTGENDDPSQWPAWDEQSPEDRSAALASILRSLGNQRRSDRAQISSLVDAELRKRCTHGLSDEERRFLIEASTSTPAVAGLCLLGRQLTGFARVLNEHRVPRWAEPPKGIANLTSWRDDQTEIPVLLPLLGCIADDRLVKRLLDEMPGKNSPNRDEEGRPCDVWLNAAAGTGSPITVNIGAHVIATVPTDHEETARALVSVHGGARNAVQLFAELRGTNCTGGSLTYYLLTPP